MPPKGFTSISVSVGTKKRLENLMKYGDSFDSKLREFLDDIEKKKRH